MLGSPTSAATPTSPVKSIKKGRRSVSRAALPHSTLFGPVAAAEASSKEPGKAAFSSPRKGDARSPPPPPVDCIPAEILEKLNNAGLSRVEKLKAVAQYVLPMADGGSTPTSLLDLSVLAAFLRHRLCLVGSSAGNMRWLQYLLYGLDIVSNLGDPRAVAALTAVTAPRHS